MALDIRIIDTFGNERSALLPNDVILQRLVPALVRKLTLPAWDENGRYFAYTIHCNDESLDHEKTLSQLGTVEGSLLHLEAEAVSQHDWYQFDVGAPPVTREAISLLRNGN